MSSYAILPKMPVPSLDGSLDRFLTALSPLLTPMEFSEAVRVARTFSEEQGPYLQDKLVRLAEETDNWAGFVSVQVRYLNNRSSLMLTNGIGTSLQSIQTGAHDTLLHNLSIYNCMYLYMIKQLRGNNLPQDMFENEPLCMEQYSNLFGVSRLPGLKTDSYCRSPVSKHIIVMRGGSFYKVPVFCAGGEEPVSVQEMYNLLSQVLAHPQGPRGEGERSVGLLTTLERDQWFSAREQLRESSINRESLAAVEGCLFGIYLDDYKAEQYSTGDRLKLGLFGDLKSPFFNRWFGLSFQTMVSTDGYLSFISEHSLVDGTLATDWGQLDSIFTNRESKIDDSLKIELLKWEISPLIQAEIEKARIMVNSLFKVYDAYAFQFADYGKDFVKSYGIHLHGYIQLAIQLAYYKLYHGLAATYLPVSLRKFRGGRLEHPHIVSEESKAFVEAMSRDCDNRERYRLMRLAMVRHRGLMSDANQGQTYCKHMLGLKMLADNEGLHVNFFQSEYFKIFTQHKLATSIVYRSEQVISIHPMPSGVGHFVVFRVEDSTIYFSVTTLLHSAQTFTSQEFGDKISASLREIQQLVVTQATDGIIESKL